MFAVFDLDGTLAKVGKAAGAETVSLLHALAEKGMKIALSSGKPTFYLCGFARQLGLEDAILIGENGGVIQEGVNLPPVYYKEADMPEITRKALKEIRRKLEKEFAGRIWYQPNETALTPFPHFQEDFPPIKKLLDDFITPEMELTVYEHKDCFDIEYSRLSKGEGLRLLSSITGVSVKDMIAFGDWTNDYSMFDVAGYSVGIDLPDPHRASVNFPTIEEGLRHILERI